MAKGRIKRGKLALKAAKTGLKHLGRAKQKALGGKGSLTRSALGLTKRYIQLNNPYKNPHVKAFAAAAGELNKALNKKPTEKVDVLRPGAGRPSVTESKIVQGLVGYAAIMKKWLMDNNRVATGVSVNSIRVVIERPTNPIQERYGIVTGNVYASPSTKFALGGRGPGGMPPPFIIWEWLKVKGITSTSMSNRDLAWAISAQIAAQGTLPPHFSAPVRTSMTSVTASKIAKDMVEPFARNVTRKWLRRIIRGYEFSQGETRSLVPTVTIKPGGFVGDERDILSEQKDNLGTGLSGVDGPT